METKNQYVHQKTRTTKKQKEGVVGVCRRQGKSIKLAQWVVVSYQSQRDHNVKGVERVMIAWMGEYVYSCSETDNQKKKQKTKTKKSKMGGG